MKESSLEKIAHALGFKKPQAALLLPLSFLVGGVVLAMILPKLDRLVPGGAPIVQVLLEIIWFCLMYFGFFKQIKRYREKYGEKAYQQLALRFFLPAGILMVAGIVRALWIIGTPIPWFPFSLRVTLSLYFVFMGLILQVRGIQSLGIDRIVFLYNVFPEKGERVESTLYQHLRHPLYSAMMHFCLGFALFSGTLEGLLCLLIFGLKLFIWSKVEEKELVDRFGESYANYRKNVPAFIPKFRSIPLLLQFLLGRR
ncbi:MAG: hypothetical protein A2W61_00635 [Deltaproteobacteria bacterium RIFCSPLOWO2_01_44_7]|nr:MAG: hypothetical protein A2712_05985 [Deltaproteobacteria bacterium RIFCSPHIGHO2_01_FULL_43_49]OGQ16680.1 MAG: hypothetical protein A3D22_07110 [Deltaproteobacteria bacterium RIFCSPHIGHO2_02_FULL_44_53]OGQ29818.1 MAG: hypothetical protein A3D98_09775 [Deltaproteobacteria bacterium RIFCSPHIGHO2_12_FULL_44_21]OGQ33108.1 MAG: hypothetical protein A2979_03755 [Deltaproteobacteria bacterium RIFCSPLOWO2_01_FULL_45_74]OGQ39603.1 MAG: hypothetical protein A2W61_00635 [Deltaproteobacteria bacterium 